MRRAHLLRRVRIPNHSLLRGTPPTRLPFLRSKKPSTGPSASSTDVQWFFSLCKPHSKKFAVVLGATAMSQMMTLALPQIVAKVTALVSAGQPVLAASSAPIFGASLALLLAGSIGTFIRNTLSAQISADITALLRRRVTEALMMSRVELFEKEAIGDLSARVVSDCAALGDLFADSVPNFIRNTGVVIGCLLMMAYTAPHLAATVTALSLVSIPASIIFGRTVQRLTKATADSNGAVGAFLTERVAGIIAIKAFGAERVVLTQAAQHIEAAAVLMRRSGRVNGAFYGGLNGWIWAVMLLVICVGGHFVATEKMSAGDLTAFLLYAVFLMMNGLALGGSFAALKRGIGFAARVRRYADVKPVTGVASRTASAAAAEGSTGVSSVSQGSSSSSSAAVPTPSAGAAAASATASAAVGSNPVPSPSTPLSPPTPTASAAATTPASPTPTAAPSGSPPPSPSPATSSPSDASDAADGAPLPLDPASVRVVYPTHLCGSEAPMGAVGDASSASASSLASADHKAGSAPAVAAAAAAASHNVVRLSSTESPSVTFKDVMFAYPRAPAKDVLKGVSLSVAPGEVVAIVGESGCGKSTLASLLLGLYGPKAGSVEVGGVDVERTNVREIVGYVPQATTLFTGTVADNITMGLPPPIGSIQALQAEGLDIVSEKAAIDELVKRALTAALARDFVDALPQGLHTPLGSGGSGLSGGQRQRLAVARALYRRPPLLVFDEATASLDREAAEGVISAICGVVAAGRAAEGKVTPTASSSNPSSLAAGVGEGSSDQPSSEASASSTPSAVDVDAKPSRAAHAEARRVLRSMYAASPTVIMITHHAAALTEADRVVVLREGVVAEAGKYVDLLKDPSSHLRKVLHA